MQIVASTEKLLEPQDQQAVEAEITKLSKTEPAHLAQDLFRALEHGVGIHHAGCCK